MTCPCDRRGATSLFGHRSHSRICTVAMSGPQKVHPKNDTSYEGFHDPSGALELDPEEEALVSTYFKSDKNWARIYVSLRMTQKSKPDSLWDLQT
eukprot:m.116036 g.116036  ORF g.116036 m.116036 type:complete len:95 (+) comp13119_c0_seq2:312-596(+)